MSQRIKELWEASDEITVSYPEQGSPVSVSEQTLKKFAELIVKECMSLCIEVEEDVELTDYVGSFRDGALMCREDIKQHFGVEE